MTDRLGSVLKAIDDANAKEPGGACLLYGQRMSAELDRLFGADVSEVLQIAARGQHIERWLSLRSDYPEGRTGYLHWRRDLGRAHGERLAGLMADAGYSEDDCARVGCLLRKEGIKRDAEVQALEDTICMVFMKWYFADFSKKHTDEKILGIVTKTARKMSADMRTRVLNEFDLPEDYVNALKAA